MEAKLKEALYGHLGKTLWAQFFFLFTFLPYVSQHPLSILIASALALSIGGFFAWQKKKPHFIFQVLGLFAGGYLVFQEYGSFRGLEPGLSFLAFLVCIKMIELKKERDLFIFFFISSVLLAGHLLNVYSFVGLLHFFISTAFMLLLMMSFYKRETWVWPQKKHFHVLKLIFLLAIPQAIFLFIFFPRIYVGHLKFPSVATQSKVGFTDKLRPGEVSEVVGDKSPMYRAKFTSVNKPLNQDLYWRGSVLQLSNGFNWDRGEVKASDKFIETYGLQKSEDDFSYQIDFAINESDVTFNLENTYELEARARAQVNVKPGEIFSVKPRAGQKISYTSHSLKDLSEHLILSDEQKKLFLQLPESLPSKLVDFAEQLLQSHQGKSESAQALMDYFYEEDYVYTLRPGSYPEETGIENFFFERKRGFCEHYSSVTALIFRLMNIPARVVTGFQGGLYNTFGDYYIIRGEDAHAWVEAYFEDQGWMRFDPVEFIAPQRIELGASEYFENVDFENGVFNPNDENMQSSSFLKTMTLRFDAYYYALNQFFIGYDLEGQTSFLKKLGLPKIKGPWLLAISFGLSFIIALLGFWFVRAKNAKRSEIDRLYQVLYKKLEKAGIKKYPWEGPLEFHQRVVTVIPELTAQELDEFKEISWGLIRLKYDRHDSLVEHKDRLKRLRHSLQNLRFHGKRSTK